MYTLERKQSPEWQMSQTSSKQQSKRYEPERKQREMLPKILKRLLTFYPHQNLKEILRRKAKKSYVHCTVIMNRISFKFLSELWVSNSSKKPGIKLFHVLYLGTEYLKAEGLLDGT